MEINFRGQYDKELFFKAVRLANKPSRKQQRSIFLMTTIVIIAAGMMFYRIIQTGDLVGNFLLALAVLGLLVLVGWIILTPYFTARKLWADPGTRRHLKGQITNQGIRYQLEIGTNEIAWGRFTRFRKADDFVTLIRNDGLLLVFPQSFFKKSADWRKFLKLVEKKLIKSYPRM